MELVQHGASRPNRGCPHRFATSRCQIPAALRILNFKQGEDFCVKGYKKEMPERREVRRSRAVERAWESNPGGRAWPWRERVSLREDSGRSVKAPDSVSTPCERDNV